MTRSCPDCGADLEGAMVVNRRLSALGYKHQDETLECPECPWRGHFGIPIDSHEPTRPACAVCGGRTYPYKLDFHRWRKALYEPTDDVAGIARTDVEDLIPTIDVHWKCEDCYYRHNGGVDHLLEDVYSLGVRHLEGSRDDD